MTVAEDLRRSIKPPELIDIGGMKRVKSERSVYVDPTDRNFRKSTGDLAPDYADLVYELDFCFRSYCLNFG